MTCHMSTTKNIFVVKIYIYCSTCYFFKWHATELYDQNQEYMFVTSIWGVCFSSPFRNMGPGRYIKCF